MDIRADERPEQGQGLEGCVFNLALDVSDNLALCVGIRYIGGNPSNHKNYRFDHANLWRDGSESPERISMTEARRILRGQGLLLRDLPVYLK